MKPELQELEEKVKQQTLLLGKLKEKSGAFKEKFENERRFVSQSSSCSVDQPQHMDDPGPSASAPLPPCKALESPAATSQGVESENGTLTFIQRMESPLRGDKLVMSDNPSEVPEDVQKNQPGNEDEPAPNPLNMDVAAPACAETCSSTTTFAACVSHTVSDTCNVIASPEPLCVPAELIDAGGGGGQNTAPCAMEAMDVSVQPALSSAESPVLMEENRPAEDSTSTAVGTDTAGKTAGHVNIPASINNGSHDKTMNVVGGGGDGGGVNTAGKSKDDISLSAQRKDSSIVQTKSVQSISAKDVSDSSKHTNISSAGRNMGSYASVVGSRTKEGGGNTVNIGGHNIGGFGGGYRRRNVVQFKWEGEGTPPVRGRVAELILEMGFKAVDIFALICPVGSYEFDLSFVKPEGLDLFWERHRRCQGLSQWSGLVPKVISRQPLIKSVTILVRNESIPEADLIVWLRRYGEVLTPLRKVLDEHGIWTGAWTVSLKLGVLGNWCES
ncbi:uncharacterized protein LOC143933332 [Lithobates pipiens]